MISVDANIILFAFAPGSPAHARARSFLVKLGGRDDVVVSEFVLTEVYLHLRNPAVLERPLTAPQAVATIHSYRRHPRWKVVGFPPESLALHESLWQAAAQKGFARRRIYDLRIALSLQAFGVTEFATANLGDFTGLGFSRVWDPTAD